MSALDPQELAFLGKYIITADLLLLTGLHIGGATEGFEIGGLDNPVIKDPITDLPYIPGSSLKGKMRSLLEWAHGLVKPIQDAKTKKWEAGPCMDPQEDVAIVFGLPAEEHPKSPDHVPGPTRLTVLDAFPKGFEPARDDWGKQVQKWEADLGEGIYTELKSENTIDRLTSEANPRSMERVPAGSRFCIRFIYDVYHPKDVDRLRFLFQGLALLEDSFLGGCGTRGSGRVKVENIKTEGRSRSYYVGGVDGFQLPAPPGENELGSLNKQFGEFFQVK